MVLVPSYVEVDGLVVPLRVFPPTANDQGAVRQLFIDDRAILDPLAYVVNTLLSKVALDEVQSLLTERQRLPLPDGLVAAPV